MTEIEFKHWAFVCFSPQDNAEQHPDAPGVAHLRWGDWLLNELKNFTTPADFAGHLNARGENVPERISLVANGESELAEGANLGAGARADLEHSRYLIVICSPRSARSRAVDETVRCFKQLGRGNRILPIVIAGEPHARQASQPGLFFDDECFSPAMRHPVLPDGTVDANRIERGYIFADARHGDDRREILAKDFQAAEAGLERAKIQLIAGLIGVGFNGLWQREQKRRFAGFAETQGQLQLAWEQTRTAQQDVAATQKIVAELQARVRAAEGKAEEAEKQLEAARGEVRDAQKKVLDAQHLPADAKRQIEEAQAKALEAQQQVQQLRNQMRAAENQLEQARQQAQDAERKLSEAQSQAAASQNQVQEIQSQTRDVQGQIQLAQAKIRDAEEQARAARSDLAIARQQSHEAQSQLQAERDKTNAARRLTKVFAVLAVLAALAAGVVWSQRKPVAPEVAKTPESPRWDTMTNQLDSDQIRLALQQGTNLDLLAVRIPGEKISETLNLAATILNDPQRSQFQGQLLDAWANTNLAAAFDWSRQLTNNESRQFALGKIFPMLATDNPTNALAALDSLQDQTKSASLVSAGWRDAMLADVFGKWAAKDPEAVSVAATNLPPGDFRQRIIADLGQRWGASNATNALAWAEALPVESDRTVAVNQIVGSWAKAALAAATNDFVITVESLPPFTNNVPLRRQLLEQVARDSGLLHLDATAQSIAAMPAGDDQQAAIVGLLSVWPEKIPTLNWLRAFPETNSQPQHIQSVLKSWAESEPAAVVQWLTNQPAASVSEEMSAAFVDGAVVKYPEFAAQWTQSVTDEAQRQKFQVQVATQWLKNDAVAAQKWIDSLELPAEIKQSLK